MLSGLCLAARPFRLRMAIFACKSANSLHAMDSVKQNCIVFIPNPNTFVDGLRTSLTSLRELTLPTLRGT